MDYPQLNLFFGLLLIFANVFNIGVRVLLSKVRLPAGLSLLSWTALIVSIFSALYIEVLFLRFMTSAFNRQMGLGLLLIGGIGALLTVSLHHRGISSRFANILLILQILASLLSVVLAFGLYRSIIPI